MLLSVWTFFLSGGSVSLLNHDYGNVGFMVVLSSEVLDTVG